MRPLIDSYLPMNKEFFAYEVLLTNTVVLPTIVAASFPIKTLEIQFFYDGH